MVGHRQPLYIRREGRACWSQQIYKKSYQTPQNTPCIEQQAVLALAMDRGCQTQDYGSDKLKDPPVRELCQTGDAATPRTERSKSSSLEQICEQR